MELTDQALPRERQRRRRGDRAEGGERRRRKRRKHREGSQAEAARDDQPGAEAKSPAAQSEDLASDSRPQATASKQTDDKKPDDMEVSDEDDEDAEIAEAGSRQRRQEAVRRREAEQRDKDSLKPNGHRDETRVGNSLADAAEHAMTDPKWKELVTAQAEAMQTGGKPPSHAESDSLHKQQAASQEGCQGTSKADDSKEQHRHQEEQQQQQIATDHELNASREPEKQSSSSEEGTLDEGQHRPSAKTSPASARDEPEPQASEHVQSSRDEPASQQHPSSTEAQSVQDKFGGFDSQPVESDPRSSREEQQVRAESEKPASPPVQKQSELSSPDSDDSDAPGWRREAPRTRQDLSEDSETKTGPTALTRGATRPSQEKNHAQNESEYSESEAQPSRRQAVSASDAAAATPAFPKKRPNRRDGAATSGRRRKSRKVADNANKKPHSKAMPKPAVQSTPEASEHQRSSRTVLHRRDRSEGRDRQRPSKEEPRGSMEDSNRDERQHPWRETAEASDHKQPFRAKLTSRDFSEHGDRDWQRSAKTGLHGRPDRSGSTKHQQSSRDGPRGRDGGRDLRDARHARDMRDVRDVRDVRDGVDATSRQWSARDRLGRFGDAPWRDPSDQGCSSLRLRSRSMSRNNRNRPPLKRIRSRSRGSPPPTRRVHSRPRHHDTRVRKPRRGS